MGSSFDQAIAALWRSLDLAPPSGAGATAPTLQIDDQSVRFSLAPNGTEIVIAARLGALASSDVARTEQLRRLLRDGLGTALTNHAGLRFAEGSATEVEALALAPCRADAVPRLRRAIEDVLQLVDVHGPTLDGAHRPSAPEAAFSPTESMIFRL